MYQQRGEDAAIQAAALMKQGSSAELTSAVAMTAGKLGNELKLPLADSIVYATAFLHSAAVWTQDSDFERLPGVKYKPKRR